MSKLNPFLLSRPKRVYEKISMTASNGQLFEITLRSLDKPAEHRKNDVWFRLVLKYVAPEERSVEFPSEHMVHKYSGFPAIGDPITGMAETIEVSESLAQNASKIFVMQVQASNGDVYSPEEIIALSVTSPEIWDKLVEVADRINAEYEKLVNKVVSLAVDDEDNEDTTLTAENLSELGG